MAHILTDLTQFLDRSPTSWHAAQEIGTRLASVDFTPLEEAEKWELEKGGKYFVQRGGSIAAFVVPASLPKHVYLLAAHTDSPALKLKPVPALQEENMTLLETETYGGVLLNAWLNRDLGIAGRVIVRSAQGALEERVVYFEDAPLFIPQLAIHLDREVNEKGLVLDKQNHLRPIATLGLEQKDFIEKLLHQQLSFQALLSFDLFLVPLEKCRFMGFKGEMLASYRLDNLLSVHACMTALASTSPTHDLKMAFFWDHEEIGSRTAEGAASPFLADLYQRICLSLGLSEEERLRLKQQTLCVSVDVAHAYNPNFSHKYDPLHKPLLGKGIILKYNADKKYASDARSAALILQACQELKVPCQPYTTHSNLSCGSTVGPLIAQGMGFATVDIGCPLFSMHSIREVAGCQDHLDMCQLLTHLIH